MIVTLPRRLLPGSHYLITRRCTQQQFLLRPSRSTNEILGYCLALAAERTGVLLHAVCVMSNHWHAVVSDPLARLPEFLERAHRMIAKCLNAALGRWENFWSSDKPSIVHLVSEEDVLAKMAYVLANPTAAGLVKSPQQWPGLMTRGLTEQKSFSMPDVFFDASGALPDEVVFSCTRPGIRSELSDAELAALLAERVADQVRRARASIRSAGRRFVGADHVLRQSVSDRPRAEGPRRGLSPRIAAADPVKRVAAIAALRHFVATYRAALEDWKAGHRERVFPAGTYALRLRAGVRCDAVDST